VRVKERANGLKHYFFQYWTHVPGQEDRKFKTYIVGPTSQMTKSEANRKKVELNLSIESQSRKCHSPSAVTFANAVSHYRNVFAPRMLRASTFSTADGHLKTHLEVDWKHISIEHITIDSINEWIWKKHDQGLSWITIKNVLRTMQRVLSSFSKDKKPPFSQLGLAIPERDKLRMRINGRRRVSFSWASGKDFRLCRQVGQTRRDPARAIFDTVSPCGRFRIAIQ
jgi:hypothetical protein